jgi:chemotaxis protein CheC
MQAGAIIATFVRDATPGAMTSSDSRLPAMQLDALREVTNIASGHAATALSQLTGRRVMISVPELSVASLTEIPVLLGYDQRVVVIAMHILGDVNGHLVFLMPVVNARVLAEVLTSRSPGPGEEFDQLGRSSLMETGNVLGGAYAGALSQITGRAVMLSVPLFGIEPPDDVLRRQRDGGPDRGDLALCLETRLTFNDGGPSFNGHILLVPSAASLGIILGALRLR